MGFLPRDPLFRDDTKGACPLWNPPCIVGSPAKNGPAGAAPRQTSAAFAEEEGGAAQRPNPAACGRMRDAKLVPTRAPFVSSRRRDIREGPHRKGPSLMRPFGYFSGEGKVPRGMGAEPLKLPNRMGSHSREKFPLTCSRYRANRNTPFAPSAPGSAPAPVSSPRGERRSRHTAPGGRAPAGGSPRSASGPPAPGWRR